MHLAQQEVEMANSDKDYDERDSEEPKYTQPRPQIDEETLRRVVSKVGQAVLQPNAHSKEHLATDAHGNPVSVWEDKATQRSVQGWIMKVAYDLFRKQSMAYAVVEILNERALEHTEGRSLDGIEADYGHKVVLQVLLTIFSKKA